MRLTTGASRTVGQADRPFPDVEEVSTVAVPSYCRECDRGFYVVDDPDLHASYRCPVCLMPGERSPDASDGGDTQTTTA